MVLGDLVVVTLGGGVEVADDADRVDEGVAQDDYDQHEGYDQDERHVGEAALGCCFLIHCRKSFLFCVSREGRTRGDVRSLPLPKKGRTTEQCIYYTAIS